MSMLTRLSTSSITIQDVLGLAGIGTVTQLGASPAMSSSPCEVGAHLILPTAAPSLRGGELLLTHGLGLRHSGRTQRRYIEELATFRSPA